MSVRPEAPPLRWRLVNESTAMRRLPRRFVGLLFGRAYARHGPGGRSGGRGDRGRSPLSALYAHGAGNLPAAVTVNALVADDEAMASLNLRYKGHAGSTDTLAFPDGDIDPGMRSLHLGDIAANGQAALRESALRQKGHPEWTARHELALYLLHGLLHLLGLDDRAPEEIARMRRAEADIFVDAGMPKPPFPGGC